MANGKGQFRGCVKEVKGKSGKKVYRHCVSDDKLVSIKSVTRKR